MKNIYWINMNRFDEKADKSTWLEIGETLVDNNFSVTLLVGYKKVRWLSKTYKLNIKYFKAINNPFLFKLSLSLAIFYWLLQNAKENDILIVSTDSLLLSVLLRKFKKCKIHLDIRTLPVEINNLKTRVDYLVFFTIPMLLFKHSPDSYSFITELLRQNLEKTFKIYFKDYSIWTSGVNVEHFAAARQGVEISENRYVLTYLGVITKNRGIDRVLMAIHRLNKKYNGKILFQIIGNGPFMPYLKKISSELGINDSVLFKGYIPYEIVPKNLRDTDCFICPLPEKLEWNVSSPIKVFEYLACTKPVILTPIVSHKNIIDRNDFIIWTEGEEVKDFVTAIEYAFNNRLELRKKSKFALDIVKNKYEWIIQGNIFGNYLKNKYFSKNKNY